MSEDKTLVHNLPIIIRIPFVLFFMWSFILFDLIVIVPINTILVLRFSFLICINSLVGKDYNKNLKLFNPYSDYQLNQNKDE